MEWVGVDLGSQLFFAVLRLGVEQDSGGFLVGFASMALRG